MMNLKSFLHAREIGSLQTIEEQDYKTFAEYLLNIEKKEVQLNMFSVDWVQNTLPLMLKLTKQAAILSRKYKVVCTNPPYMNKLESHLKKFVVDHYKDYSGDLFSVFIYRNFDFCVKDGYSAFMTPFVWMFIKSYEKLRSYIIENKAISSLIQMEYSAYEEATVPICTFVLKNSVPITDGLYIRLSDFKGGMQVQKEKVLQALNSSECNYMYSTRQTDFDYISSAPIAYWISQNLLKAFKQGKIVADVSKGKSGQNTGDNNRFLRYWYEVKKEKIGFDLDTLYDGKKYRWIPYNKGGAYRRWYGNQDYVVNWMNDGMEIKEYATKRNNGKHWSRYIQNLDCLYKQGITWSIITSSTFSMRYLPEGFICDYAGCAIFPEGQDLLYLLGLFNSTLVGNILKMINPTINYQPGNIGSVPYLYSKEKKSEIEELVKECIDLSKQDWDSFETSWNYKKHPFINMLKNTLGNSDCKKTFCIKTQFDSWSQECNNRFEQLKRNEEALNSIFIDIYGVQNELTPEIEEKNITVRKSDVQRDIKGLISYAVGCIFGRYSLDQEGIIYAGGEWDASKYTSYIPDADNIIPITDEEYFEDDIVGLLCNWLKQVYGEETLEENLDFIAKALGNKGDSSREIIRNYFLKDFFADHCKVYQKRPIYWLFDSGKENGFKALVYLHRYDADTVGRVRTDYLHKQQSYVESALRSAEYTIDNSTSSSEKSKATKAVAKYTKQLAEMKLYDEAIAHIANQRIELDLDDGVKVNYEKFQGIEVSREGQKAVKVDLLAKIK